MEFPCTGMIEVPRRQSYVEWKIPNYFHLCQKTDSCYFSPKFQFSDGLWCLVIFPNGQRCNNSTEWMELHLKRIDAKIPCIPVKFTIGIKCDDDDRCFQKSNLQCSFTSKLTHGCTIIDRYVLQRNRDLFEHGALTIFCTLELINARHSDVASQTLSVDGSEVFCEAFQKLFLNKTQTPDVTIKVKNRRFEAHRLILATRSSVFAAMFEHQMKENQTGIIEIVDSEPDIFQSFLIFVYTGRIQFLHSDQASGLFALADKYDLCDLKGKCLDFMKENLTLDIVCDVLDMAHKHDDVELEKRAKKLLIENIKEVMSSDKWISFLRENPVLATEILRTIIPGKDVMNIQPHFMEKQHSRIIRLCL